MSCEFVVFGKLPYDLVETVDLVGRCVKCFVCVMSCVFPRAAGSNVICCFEGLIRVVCISLEIRCW